MDPANSGFQPIILMDLNTEWEAVFSLGTPVNFTAKTIISASSYPAAVSGLYYIRRGRVRLSHIASNGQEKVMLYMGKGVLFNEIPMLHVGEDYLFTCMEQTDTVFWPKKRINADFIRQYPELMLNLLESMSSKSRGFYNQLCGLRSFDAFVNVCRTLYSMYQHNKVDGVIVPRLTQQEIAAFLGVHRSSLHKALVRLKDEGVISAYNRKELEVYNPDKLFEYANGIGCD